MEKQILWVPESKKLEIPKKPKRVWTLILKEHKEEEPPEIPKVLTHLRNGFLEDFVHDWNWKNGQFRYYSRIRDGGTWIVVEY